MKNETFKKIKENWISFIDNNENKPSKDEDGHRINGKVLFEHYILWALLRNKNPESSSRDPSSESYRDAYGRALSSFNKKDAGCPIFKVFIGDNLKPEDIDIN